MVVGFAIFFLHKRDPPSCQAERDGQGTSGQVSADLKRSYESTFKIIGAAMAACPPSQAQARWAGTRELGCGFMMPFERAIGNCLLRSLGL